MFRGRESIAAGRRCPGVRLGLLSVLAAVAAGLLRPADARAGPRCALAGTPWLEGRVQGQETPLARQVDARRGETIEVHVAAPGRLEGRRVVFSDSGAPGRVSWTASGCPAAGLRWRRVEPRMQHVDTPPPNAGLQIYANALVFGPRHGAWLGFDALEYVEAPLPEGEDRWSVTVTGARPTDAALAAARGEAYRELGTMRLAATLSPAEGPARSTADARDRPRGEISGEVFRYSVRAGDDVFGWLTAYFNVPYVFGSAGVGARSQAERFIGADCADLIVAALRRAGRSDMPYSSVGGLVRGLVRVAEAIAVPGPAQSGYAPRPGDILALEYVGADALPRAWDHVVVFAEDRGPAGTADGALGPEDLVADIGDGAGLKFAPLGDQGAVRALPLRARGTRVTGR